LRWYRANRRDLPWRADKDPYRVWLSEIMLQQTRVNAVLEHYREFLERFPTVGDLAAARLPAVLAAWSGLGYYRRARALHAAAKMIVKERGGRFPVTAADLRTLPGVGRYTASAIASIAFNRPVAVVDGNVERVLRRVTGQELAGEKLWAEAEAGLSRRHPGDYNQAMMELGAIICTPRQPRCLVCPVSDLCATRGESPKAKAEVRQRKEIHYALGQSQNSVYLVKRGKSESLMPGMWELPEIAANGHTPVVTLRHSITVTDYVVQVVEAAAPESAQGRWLPYSRLKTLPLTGLTKKILRATGII